jgi:MSHA biogenesis protein MshN
MSLINTMLQELDQRRGRPGGEAIPGDPIRSVKRESPWHLGRNALLLAVAIVATGLATAWWLQQRNSARPVPIVSAAAPTALPATAAPTSVPPRPQPAPAVATAPAAAPVPQRVVATSTELATPPAKKAATVPLARANNASPSNAKSAPPVVAAEAPPVARVATASPTVADTALPGKPESADVQPSPSKIGAANQAIVSKTYSAKQSSANLIAEAVRLDQKGRQEEAKAPLQRLLATDPRDVEARQMLIQLQLDTGNVEEARALSREGQRLFPEEPSFTLGLARLQVEAGDVGDAIELLEARQAGARGDPQYHALLGALLLRVRRYDDAVQHYLVALRSDPANVQWLVGAGVAFEGVGNTSDARAAYRRAEGSAGLNPESARFLAERLASIGR